MTSIFLKLFRTFKITTFHHLFLIISFSTWASASSTTTLSPLLCLLLFLVTLSLIFSTEVKTLIRENMQKQAYLFQILPQLLIFTRLDSGQLRTSRLNNNSWL